MRTTVLAVALLLALAACGTGSSNPWTADDSGEQIELEMLEEFEIHLDSNPSTGFGWYIADDSMPAVLSLTGDGFIAPDVAMPGAAGVQWFHFEATEAGAGVLRLEYLRPFEEPAIPEQVVEYIVRVDGAAWPPTGVAVPATSTATAPVIGPRPAAETVPLDELSAYGAGDVVVAGFLVDDGALVRLCDALAESYPPQCGGESVVVTNSEVLTLEWRAEQGVRWIDLPVVFEGTYDGRELTLR